MSGEYQVIARKWRPQTFADVVGQQHVVRTLQNAIRSGRTAHAYLFVGPRGVGKTTLARIFAKALNCLAPEDGNPCGKCDSCRAISNESSLDVMEVDAASRNTTTDMRDLAEDVLTAPVSGRYKIYIIDEVHMLSKAAWNVLLKTVEEPPPHVKFIFATTEVHQVLPTIISRCQRFDLLPIPTRLIAERLRLIADAEKVPVSAAAVEAIARAAEGGMRDAQSLLDQMIAFFAGGGAEITGEQVLSLFGLTDRADLLGLLSALLENRPGDAVRVVSSLKKKGKNLETLYDDLLAALRAVELSAILADPSELIDESAENLAGYKELAGRVPPDVPRVLLENLAPAGRLLRDALNKQVLLETVLLKAMREAHAVKLDDVLKRLNQLRSAGELKFLDQVPPVRNAERPAAPPQPAPPQSAPPPKAVAPAPEPKVVVPPLAPKPEPAPVAEAQPEPPKLAPKKPDADLVIELVRPATNPAPAVEPVPEPKPEPPKAAAPAPEAPEPPPVVPKYAAPVPEPKPAPAPKSESKPRRAEPAASAASPDGRKRVSIANSDPQAVRDAAKNDPDVGRLAELFDSDVIDIHRPAGQ
jgi:DNA polymerase-3 subunit gamma/tau